MNGRQTEKKKFVSICVSPTSVQNSISVFNLGSKYHSSAFLSWIRV